MGCGIFVELYVGIQHRRRSHDDGQCAFSFFFIYIYFFSSFAWVSSLRSGFSLTHTVIHLSCVLFLQFLYIGMMNDGQSRRPVAACITGYSNEDDKFSSQDELLDHTP